MQQLLSAWHKSDFFLFAINNCRVSGDTNCIWNYTISYVIFHITFLENGAKMPEKFHY